MKYSIDTEDTLFKSTLPVYFFFIRLIYFGCAIPLLYIAKDDYAIVLTILFLAVISTLNKLHFTVEVFKDKFNIIQPSFYGKRFDDVDTYYFNEISEFEYFKKETNFKTILLGILASRFVSTDSLSEPPVVRFKNNSNNEEQTVSYTFRRSNSTLIKGLEFISTKLS